MSGTPFGSYNMRSLAAPSGCIWLKAVPALLCSLLLSGCVLVRSAFAPEPLPVLNTNLPNAGVTLRQRIKMTYGEKSFSFQAVVELHNDRMVVAGISSYSTTLFTLRIQDGTVHVDKQADIPFDLTRLATDLQWSLWPRIPDRRGFTIRERETEQGLERTIVRNGSPAGTVHARKRPPWSGNVRFVHPDGYTMHIKFISKRPLSNKHDG